MKKYRYRIYQTENELKHLAGSAVAYSRSNRLMRVAISNYVLDGSHSIHKLSDRPKFEVQQGPSDKQSTLTVEEIHYIHTTAKLIGFQEALIAMLESKGIRNEYEFNSRIY